MALCGYWLLSLIDGFCLGGEQKERVSGTKRVDTKWTLSIVVETTCLHFLSL